jgi:hypothetical protein
MGALLSEHAWAAGIIDGEGYITVRITHTSYSLLVRVAMTSEVTVQRLQAIFGCGGLRSETRRKDDKRVFVWSACGGDAAQVLETIQPYLVTKRREAQMARAYAGLPKAGRISPVLKLVRRSLYIGLRHLKL